jgi:hypothetical protein
MLSESVHMKIKILHTTDRDDNATKMMETISNMLLYILLIRQETAEGCCILVKFWVLFYSIRL